MEKLFRSSRGHTKLNFPCFSCRKVGTLPTLIFQWISPARIGT
jgi:hypothetical protein